MKGHTTNRQIQSVLLGMVKDAQRRLDEVKHVDKESAEYWHGFIDSLHQVDIF